MSFAIFYPTWWCTGDLLHPVAPATFESEAPRIDELLRRIPAPLGFFTVHGDTDAPIRDALVRGLGGMRYLEDQAVEIRAGGSRVRVLGLSIGHSHHASSARPMVGSWLGEAEPGDLTIVLGHAPDYMLGTQDLAVDLQLAGHTHGGQIRIPFLGPMVTFSRVPREWARGFRKVGATHVNVSAGVGAEHAGGLPSIRLFCPPEISVIDVVPGRRSDDP